MVNYRQFRGIKRNNLQMRGLLQIENVNWYLDGGNAARSFGEIVLFQEKLNLSPFFAFRKIRPMKFPIGCSYLKMFSLNRKNFHVPKTGDCGFYGRNSDVCLANNRTWLSRRFMPICNIWQSPPIEIPFRAAKRNNCYSSNVLLVKKLQV